MFPVDEEEQQQLPVTPSPAAPPANEWDAAARRLKTGQEVDVKTNIGAAQQTTPDRRAQALTLADKYRVSPDMVERNLDYFTQLQAEDNTFSQVLVRAPKLRDWLASEPWKAAAAADDIERLSQTERVVDGWATILRGIDNVQSMWGRSMQWAGQVTGSEGLKAYGRSVAEFNEQQAADLGYRLTLDDITDIESFGTWLKQGAGEQLPIMATISGGAASGAVIGGVIGNVPGATVGAIIGGFLPSFALGVGETTGAIAEIDPDKEAPLVAFVGGSAIAALDSILPVKIGSKLVQQFGRETAEQVAKRALLARVKPQFLLGSAKDGFTGFMTEGLTEAIQEAIGAVAASQGGEKPINGAALWSQMKEAAATGAFVGGGANVATTMVTHHREMARYAQSQQSKLFFDALAEGAKGSALAARLPEVYQEVVARMTKDGPVENVFVDVKEFEEYFQSKNISPDVVAAELTGSQEALAQARESGVPLSIPTAAYAARLAATEHHGFFANELRTSPDAPNAREGKALEAQVAAQALDVQRVVEAAAAGTEAPEAKLTPLRQAIQAQVLADPAFHSMVQAAQADPVVVADVYAAGVDRIITNLATLSGEDPIALLDTYNLSIGSEGTRNTLRAALQLVQPAEQAEAAPVDADPAATALRLSTGAARTAVLYQAARNRTNQILPKGFEVVAPHLLPEERASLRRDVVERTLEAFRSLPGEADYMAAALAGRAKRGWYQRSAAAIQTLFGETDAPRFAALLAALSPRTSVEANLINAVSTWRNWVEAGRPTSTDAITEILGRSVQQTEGKDSVLPAWIPNTVRALQTEDAETIKLSGDKVNPFMQNLLGRMQQVTTDSWMTVFAATMHAITGGGLSRSAHLAFGAKIRRVAAQLTTISGETWTPAEVQETVWSWAKTLYELSESEGMTAEEILRAGLLTDAAITSTPDFAMLFTQDAPVREILEAAGYGDVLAVIEADIDPAATDGAGAAAQGAAGAGAAGETAPVTPSLLRSARRLDWVRAGRQAIARNPYEDLLAKITAEGGFSYEVLTGVEPVAGKALAMFPEQSAVIPVESLTPGMLGDFVLEHAETLLQPGNHLGAWLSEGQVYLDISRVVKTDKQAQEIGRKNEQIAYFDLSSKKSVTIEYPEGWIHGETWQGKGGPGAVGTSGPADAADAAGGSADDRGDLAALSEADRARADDGGAAGAGDEALSADFVIGPDGDVVLFQEAARETDRAETADAEGEGRAAVPAPAKAPRRPAAPNPDAQAVADRYAETVGRLVKAYDYVEVDIVRAVEIADAYDRLPVDDSANPDAKRAYLALAKETQAQWDFLIAEGIQLLPWTSEGQPYANSNEMAQDVRVNRRLYFFTGGEDHPFIGDATRDETGLTINDKFRAIHDYFGHAAGGYGFGPRGEENAWRIHSQMFSADARRAMTTETRGQNSWVNFGRQNWNPDGTYKDIPPADRPYAAQKVALLDDAFVFQAVGDVTLYQQDALPAQPTVAQWAESRIYRTVESAKQGKASGRDWKAIIKGSKLGVNADEFALTHVGDLDDTTSYTKAEVLEYLRANQVRVDWVALSSDGPTRESIRERADALFEEAVQAKIEELEKRGPLVEGYRPPVEYQPIEADDEDAVEEWRVEGESFDNEADAEAEADRRQLEYERFAEEEVINDIRGQVSYDAMEAIAEEQLQEELAEQGKLARFVEYQLDRGASAEPNTYREVFLTASSIPSEIGFAALTPAENLTLKKGLSDYLKELLLRESPGAPIVTTVKDEREGLTRTHRDYLEKRLAEHPAGSIGARTLAERIAILDKIIADGTYVYRESGWKDGHDAYASVDNPIVRLRYNVRQTQVVTRPARELDQTVMQAAIDAHTKQATFTSDIGLKPGEMLSEEQARQYGQLNAAIAAGKAEMLAAREERGPGGRVLFLEELQPPREGKGQFDSMPPLFQKHWRDLAFKWALRQAAEQGLDGVAWTTGDQQADRYSLAQHVEKIDWVPQGRGRMVALRVGDERRSFRMTVDEGGIVTKSDDFLGAKLADVVGETVAARILGEPTGELKAEDLVVGGEGLSRLYDVDLVNVAQKLPAVKKAGVKVGTVEVMRGAAGTGIGFTSPQHFLPLTPELKAAVLGGQVLFHEEQSDEPTKRGKIVINQAGIRIELLEHANLSTFLHETGHLYLHVLGDLVEKLQKGDPATWTDGQRQLIADRDRIYAFLGVASRDQIGREQHETFARAFEAYLMKGKAPVKELRSAFGRYRSWLTKIYKSITNLHVALNAEIVEVFDRLVASSDAIAQAKQEAQQTPVFSTAAQAGMTDIEWQGYQGILRRAHEQAEDELARQILDELKRERQTWWRQKRAEVREDIARQLRAQPVYQALAFLQGDTRLSKDAIVEKYGKDRLATLPRPYVYAVEGGLDPDQAAELLGYSSGDALLTALAESEKLDVVADREANARMQAEFGNMRLDGTLREEARKAVQERGYEDVVAAELRALAKAARAARPIVAAAVAQADAEEASARRAARQAMAASSVTTAQVNAIAEARIAQVAPKDLNPRRYWLNAKKEGTASAQAAQEGKYEAAVLAKQRQRLSLALYKAAQRAEDEVEKLQRYAKRMADRPAQARLGRAGESYQAQVNALLNKFEFTSISNAALDRRATLSQWVTEREAEGLPVNLPADVLEAMQRVNFKLVPMVRLREMRDAVKTIDHLAKLKGELLTAKDTRSYEAARDRLVTWIRDHNEMVATPLEFRRKDVRKLSIANFFASHKRIATLAQKLDGFIDGGPMVTLFVRPLNAAADAETSRRRVEGERYNDIIRRHYPGRQLGLLNQKVFIPALGQSLSKEATLAVALNYGNEQNRQRLVTDPKRQWTIHQVEAILDTLDQRDWSYVQETWDFLDSFWQEISDKQFRVTGLRPEKVEAAPVDTKYGRMRGGYYPLAYDGRLSVRASTTSAITDAKLQLAGAYIATTTKRGHTQQRVEHLDRSLRLELGVMFSHLDQVLHDLTHHETLVDVARLLRDPKVADAIHGALGTAGYQQFTDALTDIAVGQKPAKNLMDDGAAFAKTGTQIAALGLNLWTAMQQPLGLFNGAARVGPTWVARGMFRWMRDATTMENTLAWVREVSPFMANRSTTQNQDIMDLRGRLAEPGGWFDRLLRQTTAERVSQQNLTDAFLWHISLAQRVADVPTWLGQYEKSKANGKSDEDAVAEADQAVKDSQGGGQTVDLASVQRLGPTARLFMVFYSYGNTVYNQTARAVGKTQFTSPVSLARFLGDLSLIYFFPALGTVVLSRLLRGSGEDDDDLFDVTGDVLAEMGGSALNSMVVVRELGGLVRSVNRGYQGPAGTRVLQQLYGLASQVSQGEVDEGLWKALNNTGGILFRYPAGQAQRTVEGFTALAEGDTANPLALLFGAPRE